MNKLLYLLQFVPLAIICHVFKMIPIGLSCRLWRLFALLIYHLFPSLSRTARENIHLTIGRDWTEQQIEDLVRKSYIHCGYFIAELLDTPNLGPTFNAQHVTVNGEHHVRAALVKGKGVIFVTGHFGNWEMMGHSMRTMGLNLNVIYKKMKNPYVDKLLYSYRTRYSESLIEIKEWRLKCPTAVAKNEIIGIVSDQDARHHGIFVDFLGKKASTFVGPAYMSLEFDAPIVMCYFWREKPGKYNLSFDSVPAADASADRESQIRSLTEQWVCRLEGQIRRFPDQYFWFHRRWKTQPIGPSSDAGDKFDVKSENGETGS